MTYKKDENNNITPDKNNLPDDVPAGASEVDGYRHPGFKWLDEAACADVPNTDFFVEAGHVLGEKAKKACMSCSVWADCIIFSYVGSPDGRPVTGGYWAGLSPGQRKKLSLQEALDFGTKARQKKEHTPRRRNKN